MAEVKAGDHVVIRQDQFVDISHGKCIVRGKIYRVSQVKAIPSLGINLEVCDGKGPECVCQRTPGYWVFRPYFMVVDQVVVEKPTKEQMDQALRLPDPKDAMSFLKRSQET